MSYKILEQNGIDIENIDGGAFNNFAAGNRDGILKGVLNECSLVAEGNSISIGTGVIILQGIRVKITDPEIISVSSVPSEPVRYQIVAQIIMTEGNLSCSFFVRVPAELIRDNFYNSGKGNGTYQQEIGRFTHNTDGSLSDVQMTIGVISGGGGGSTSSIEIGDVTTSMLDAGLPAEVDIDKRIENGQELIDFKFFLPKASASTIFTIQNLTTKEKNKNQFVSDVFSPEEEIEGADTVCLQGLDTSSLSPDVQNYVNSIENSGLIYLSRVSPKAFFAVFGSTSPDLLEVNSSGSFVLYLAGNDYGQYQLFGTVLSDQTGAAVSAVFDNDGNPLVNKYVKPDTGIPESDLSAEVQEKLGKSGGTTVVANPTDSGEEELTSIQVSDVVYNIPSTEIVFSTEAVEGAIEVQSFSAGGQNFAFPSGGTALYRHIVTVIDTDQTICFISTSGIQITELSQINPENIVSFVYYSISSTSDEKNPVVVYNFMPGGNGDLLYLVYLPYSEASSSPSFETADLNLYSEVTDSPVSTFSLTGQSRSARAVIDTVTKM